MKSSLITSSLFLFVFSLLFSLAVEAAYSLRQDLPEALSGHGFLTRKTLEALQLQEQDYRQCERTRKIPGFRLGEGFLLDKERFYR